VCRMTAQGSSRVVVQGAMEAGETVKEKLTVIVPTYNEEKNVRDCLESVKWADEIIVVDSFSTDSTVEICREYPVKLVQHEYVNSAAQKNWILPQTANRWVLIVDSDERVTREMREEIKTLLESGPGCDGYWIRRKNRFMGKEIRFCGWQRDRVLRLFDRDKGRYEDKHVHADVELQGNVGILRECLLHDTYKDFSSYLRKLDKYTDWGAEDLATRGKARGVLSLAARPAGRFVRMYLFQLGFLDGVRGFIICTLGATSVFLKYAKFWRASLVAGSGKGKETK
jgi:glycosyltransferase involved in cell wall biosynthesis